MSSSGSARLLNSFVGIEHHDRRGTGGNPLKCELRAQAEKVGEDSVQRTGEKARRAADKAVG